MQYVKLLLFSTSSCIVTVYYQLSLRQNVLVEKPTVAGSSTGAVWILWLVFDGVIVQDMAKTRYRRVVELKIKADFELGCGFDQGRLKYDARK